MSSFSIEASREYWRQTSPDLARLFDKLDAAESWVIDQPGEAMDRALNHLGAHENEIDWERLPPELLIKVLAYVRTSRALRIADAMGLASPRAFESYREASQKHPDIAEYNINRQRLTLFMRIHIMARIFAKERRQLLLECLEEAEHED